MVGEPLRGRAERWGWRGVRAAPVPFERLLVRLLSAACLPLLIAGCAPPAATGNTATDLNAAAAHGQADVNAYAASNAATASDTPAARAPLAPAGPGQPGGLPDHQTPVSEAPSTPDSPQGAATVVETYYALIGAGKFDQAYALWDDGGQASGKNRAAFAAELAAYRDYHATVGTPGRENAGAGQRHVQVPVQVYARRGDGTPAYWRGDVTLHRVAGIDGATAAHKDIDRKPTPGTQVASRPGAGDAGDAPAIAADRYRCMDGAKISVSYDNRAGTATVKRGGRTLPVLGDKRPPSGIWYGRGGYDLRGRHDMATLTIPGRPPIACAVIK